MTPAEADKSNGYEENAEEFMGRRNQKIGVATVREWCSRLPKGCAVLELGCGCGAPISQVLVDEGFNLHAVDASPKMIAAFRTRFPGVPAECCAAEDSRFFDRTFDAVIAWGLMFLLPAELQPVVVAKAARALNSGGQLLFTAPKEITTWIDVLTRLPSASLGYERYHELLRTEGCEITGDAMDEGENYYYLVRRCVSAE
jgi:SAM-dependent methyltransferase